MKSRLLATACMIVMGASATSAFAAEADEAVSASDANTIQEVVITAEHRTQSVQKSSLAIAVISAAALKDAGISQIRDITSVLPGVQIGQGGPTTQIYIRGIGDFGSTPNTNPAVATYIDGVYIARANSTEGNFFDISRVEVLKGPQGTLYGRNSAGGALNIISNSPVLGERFGALNVEIGNYSKISVDGMFNMPISDTMAVRGAFQAVNRKGYSSAGFDDDKKESGRLSLLWEPSSDVSLRVTGTYTHVGGTGPGYLLDTNNFPAAVRTQLSQLTGAGLPAGGVQVPTDPRISITDPRAWNVLYGIDRLSYGQRLGGPGEVGPFNGVTSPPYCLPAVAANTARVNGVVSPFPFQVPGLCGATINGRALPSPPGGLVATWDPSQWQKYANQENRYWNITAQLDWNLGFANLTVIPAFRRTNMDYATYPVGMFDNGGRTPEVSESYSLEARLAKDTPLVDWVAGAYFFHERQVQNSGSDVGELQSGYLFNTYNPTKIRTNNYAFFAQGSWHVGPDLRLITGLRYSSETKHNSGLNISVFPSIDFAAGQPCFNSPTTDCVTDVWNGSIKFNATNWKLGVEYDLTPDNMLFATAATGFKAGGLNTRSINYPVDVTPISFKPEKLKAYEIGSRNRFLEGRLQVNLEGYYWIYRDHQESASFASPTGRFLSATQNSGSAKVYGADVNVTARVTDKDTLQFNAEYNHTEYESFTFVTSGSTIPGLDTNCRIVPIPGVTANTSLDCSGFPLAQAPLWSGSVSWTHSFELANGDTIDAQINGQYADKRYLSNYFNEQVHAPSYFVTNVNATYRSSDGKWTAAVFGRNLSDEVVYNGAFAIRGLHHGIQVVNVGAPRTYGVRLGVTF